jgi:hypothetical protein
MVGCVSRKGTVRRALSSFGNMPELRHPTPKRPIYHEILVHGYGNGTNTVSITAGRSSPVGEEEEEQQQPRKQSSDSTSTSAEDMSSRWSNSSIAEGGFGSSTTSLSTSSRKNSVSIEEFLDSPILDTTLPKRAGTAYSESICDDSMQPEPLQVKKDPAEGFMKVTTEVKVE